MAQLPSAFNAKEHEEMADFSAMPSGDYSVAIKDSEMKVNSKGTGSFLKIRFEIIEGEYKGRLLFSNLNLIHTNPTAVEMAQKELATICKAVGRVSINDSEELHGCQLTAKVIKKEATASFPAGNDIKNYSALKGAAQPSQKATTTVSATPKKSNRVSFD